MPGVCAAPTCRLTGLRRAVPGPASLLEPVSSQANQPPSAPSPAGCRPALPSWQRRRAAHRSSPRLSAGPEGRAHSGGLSWQQGLRRQIRWVAAELCVQGDAPGGGGDVAAGTLLWLLTRVLSPPPTPILPMPRSIRLPLLADPGPSPLQLHSCSRRRHGGHASFQGYYCGHDRGRRLLHKRHAVRPAAWRQPGCQHALRLRCGDGGSAHGGGRAGAGSTGGVAGKDCRDPGGRPGAAAGGGGDGS